MTPTQNEKALLFQDLHRRPGVLLIPNPWDAGSARILAGLGFEAFATSSAAAAGVLGRCDGKLTRDEALAHARAIVNATDLPVAADLEHGFGDSPAVAAETIHMAGSIGLVGGSIEDARATVTNRSMISPSQPSVFQPPFKQRAPCLSHSRSRQGPRTLSAAIRIWMTRSSG